MVNLRNASIVPRLSRQDTKDPKTDGILQKLAASPAKFEIGTKKANF
jgi:hypothetical protein